MYKLNLKIIIAVIVLVGAFSAQASENRYILKSQLLIDKKSNLIWTRDANMPRKMLTAKQAAKFIESLNRRKYGGYSNWHIPSMQDFNSSFDFAIWHKGLESKNHRLAKKIGIVGFRSGYYHTSSAHTTGYKGGYVGPDYDSSTGALKTDKLDIANWEDGGWWNDTGYLWPVAGSSK